MTSGRNEIQSDLTTITSTAEPMEENQRIDRSAHNFTNCDFMLVSVAQMERLQSIAEIMTTSLRHNMIPQLLHAILFLREHERFRGKISW